MPKLRKLIPENTERFILFFSGIIVSATVSSLLAGFIVWSDLLLIVAIILVVIAATYFFVESNRRIQTLADKMETSVYYTSEVYREQEDIPFKGVLYNELRRLVGEAKEEILTLATFAIDEGKGRITDPHPSRLEYFLALEECAVRHKESGFKYVRIHQMPRGEQLPVTRYLSKETSDHYRRVLDLERCNDERSKLNISIMKVPTQRLTSFIVIDKRYVLLGVDGIDLEGRAYPAGMFVFEDKNGKLVKSFLQYFENLERLALPITLSELETE